VPPVRHDLVAGSLTLKWETPPVPPGALNSPRGPRLTTVPNGNNPDARRRSAGYSGVTFREPGALNDWKGVGWRRELPRGFPRRGGMRSWLKVQSIPPVRVPLLKQEWGR
jgi:hypothetical protein